VTFSEKAALSPEVK